MAVAVLVTAVAAVELKVVTALEVALAVAAEPIVAELAVAAAVALLVDPSVAAAVDPSAVSMSAMATLVVVARAAPEAAQPEALLEAAGEAAAGVRLWAPSVEPWLLGLLPRTLSAPSVEAWLVGLLSEAAVVARTVLVAAEPCLVGPQVLQVVAAEPLLGLRRGAAEGP